MTRQLLLDAAMDRFVASGYAATRIDEIASAAGTTRVTFYAYFPSKSEVIKALIAERLEDELVQLRSPRGSSLGGRTSGHRATACRIQAPSSSLVPAATASARPPSELPRGERSWTSSSSRRSAIRALMTSDFEGK